jgi:hypothetical protein
VKSLTPRTRRVKPKPELEARLGPSVPGVCTLFLHRGEECHGYYLRRLPSDFGVAFGLDKFGAQGSGSYDVLLDPERGHHLCDCLGHERHGYCKHTSGLMQLWRAGKLDHIPEAI